MDVFMDAWIDMWIDVGIGKHIELRTKSRKLT